MTDIEQYYSLSDPISRCRLLQATPSPSEALIEAACHDPDFRVRHTLVANHHSLLTPEQTAALKEDPSHPVRYLFTLENIDKSNTW